VPLEPVGANIQLLPTSAEAESVGRIIVAPAANSAVHLAQNIFVDDGDDFRRWGRRFDNSLLGPDLGPKTIGLLAGEPMVYSQLLQLVAN
jgi:hypothetical protein